MSSSSGGGGRSGSSGRGRGSNRGRNRGGRGGSGGASVIRHGGGGKSNRPHPSSQLAPSQVASANADTNTNNRNTIEENEAEPDPHAVCLVCYDDTLPHQRAILPCGHDGVCGPCHLRLRYLNTDKCVIQSFWRHVLDSQMDVWSEQLIAATYLQVTPGYVNAIPTY